jgi:DNA-binding transcriptional regulator LsrR (DeoR family)
MAGRRHAYQRAAPSETVPVTQLELAEAASLSRSSAAVLLQELVQQRVIRTDYRMITILNAPALEQVLSE